MINVFKALNPLNVLWLAVLLFALRAVYWFNMPIKMEFAFTTLFARLLIPVTNQYSFPPLLNLFAAALLVFIQALLLNNLVNNYNLLGKPTFLPALMYVTVSSLFTPFLVLTPPLFCNFLVIWMLFKLLGLYKSKDSKSTAYDLGLIVATGSIVYLPFIYFFLLIWIGLIIFRPINWREFAAAIIGYISVFFFLAVYYFLNNRLSQFFEIWRPLLTRFPSGFNINYYNYLVLVPVVIIFILCFIKIQQNFFRSYVQIRKSFQLLLIMFLIAGFSFYVKAAFQLNHFLLGAVPASLFFSYYFLHAKRKWFYETLFFIQLITIIYFQFNTF